MMLQVTVKALTDAMSAEQIAVPAQLRVIEHLGIQIGRGGSGPGPEPRCEYCGANGGGGHGGFCPNWKETGT
jgi:hypothetical protein